MDLGFDRRAALDGIKTIWPLMVPGIPVGLVVGLVIAERGVPAFLGYSTSWIIFAGSSQLAAVELIGDSASALVIILTVFFINARHIIYSAALRERFSVYPLWIRVLAPYLLTDQQFAVSETAPELVDPTPRYRLWHFLGAGVFMWSVWQLAVIAGLLVGDVVRDEWQLIFSVPILFLGLMILSIKNRAGVASAFVGGTLALLGRDLPSGSGLLIAIIAGMAVGAFIDQRTDNHASEVAS